MSISIENDMRHFHKVLINHNTNWGNNLYIHKSSPELMLTFLPVGPLKQTSVIYESKYNDLLYKNALNS